MTITKLKIFNFKKYYGEHIIEFNSNKNVIIGDNETGKSTILQALDLVISGNVRKIEAVGLENIFNNLVIEEFKNSDKDIKNLPKLIIEVYLEGINDIKYSGNNNTEEVVCEGFYLKIEPNNDYIDNIKNIISKVDFAFPFEYYKIDFKYFSKDPYNSYNRPLKHVFIDSSNINDEYYAKEYTNSLFKDYTTDIKRIELNNSYRDNKMQFNQELENIIEDSDLKFGLNTDNKSSLENNLSLYEDGINILNKGAGSQCMLKIIRFLNRANTNIDLVLLEEPENHLSANKMKELLNKISDDKNTQMIITTHNSEICSRLNLKNIIALGNNKITKLNSIKEDTADFFIKCTNNNLLNYILSEKIILVEGAAEYILMEKFYKMIKQSNHEDDGVDIISVNGLSFKRYLDVALKLNKRTVVITDNDRDYEHNITNKYKDYQKDYLKICSDTNLDNYTFEVCLYNCNKTYINGMYPNIDDTCKHILNNKAEFAYELLKKLEENCDDFIIPNYIKEAIEWI